MKKTLFILFIFIVNSVIAQRHRPASYTQATMTPEFSDSLKKDISRAIPSHYNMKLIYVSNISPEGKLLKPLISREVANGTVEDNDFVQKMRYFIMGAPAWKPAFDNAQNKSVDDFVTFSVDIDDSRITITDKTKN